MGDRAIDKYEPNVILVSKLPCAEDWDVEIDSIHISEIAGTGIETWEEFLGILTGQYNMPGDTSTEG